MSLLDDLSSSIAAAAAAASPSVVGIGARLRGSGVVIGKDRVLTNVHNIRGEEVTVTFADGRSPRGRVQGTDVDGDLAVIDVDTAGAPALAWAEGSAAVGSVVFGLAATSAGGPRVTVGTVSAVNRAFPGPGETRMVIKNANLNEIYYHLQNVLNTQSKYRFTPFLNKTGTTEKINIDLPWANERSNVNIYKIQQALKKKGLMMEEEFINLEMLVISDSH